MRRLNTQDALLLYGEASGWPLHLGVLQLYDAASVPGGLSTERVRELCRQRLPHLPEEVYLQVAVGGVERQRLLQLIEDDQLVRRGPGPFAHPVQRLAEAEVGEPGRIQPSRVDDDAHAALAAALHVVASRTEQVRNGLSVDGRVRRRRLGPG